MYQAQPAKKQVRKSKKVLGVGHVVIVEVGVAGEEVGEEVEEVLAVQDRVGVPVAGARRPAAALGELDVVPEDRSRRVRGAEAQREDADHDRAGGELVENVLDLLVGDGDLRLDPFPVGVPIDGQRLERGEDGRVLAPELELEAGVGPVRG